MRLPLVRVQQHGGVVFHGGHRTGIQPAGVAFDQIGQQGPGPGVRHPAPPHRHQPRTFVGPVSQRADLNAPAFGLVWVVCAKPGSQVNLNQPRVRSGRCSVQTRESSSRVRVHHWWSSWRAWRAPARCAIARRSGVPRTSPSAARQVGRCRVDLTTVTSLPRGPTLVKRGHAPRGRHRGCAASCATPGLCARAGWWRCEGKTMVASRPHCDRANATRGMMRFSASPVFQHQAFGAGTGAGCKRVPENAPDTVGN